jgi:hypothetical protein
VQPDRGESKVVDPAQAPGVAVGDVVTYTVTVDTELDGAIAATCAQATAVPEPRYDAFRSHHGMHAAP